MRFSTTVAIALSATASLVAAQTTACAAQKYVYAIWISFGWLFVCLLYRLEHPAYDASRRKRDSSLSLIARCQHTQDTSITTHPSPCPIRSQFLSPNSLPLHTALSNANLLFPQHRRLVHRWLPTAHQGLQQEPQRFHLPLRCVQRCLDLLQQLPG